MRLIIWKNLTMISSINKWILIWILTLIFPKMSWHSKIADRTKNRNTQGYNLYPKSRIPKKLEKALFYKKFQHKRKEIY